jgi:hypothetical protein
MEIIKRVYNYTKKQKWEKNQKCGQKQFYNDTNKHMTES